VFIFPPPDTVYALIMLILYNVAFRLQKWAAKEASRGDVVAAVCNLLPIYIPFLQSLNILLVLLGFVSCGVLVCQLTSGSSGQLRPVHIPLNIARVWLLEVCTHTPTILFLQPFITSKSISRAFSVTGALAVVPAVATLILSIAFWDVDGSEPYESILKDLSGSLPRLGMMVYHGIVAVGYLLLLVSSGGSRETRGCFSITPRPTLRPYAWSVFLLRILVVVGLLVSAWQPDEDNFSVTAFDITLYALSAIVLPLCLYASMDAETSFWRGDLRLDQTSNSSENKSNPLRIWLSLFLFCFRGKGYAAFDGGLRRQTKSSNAAATVTTALLSNRNQVSAQEKGIIDDSKKGQFQLLFRRQVSSRLPPPAIISRSKSREMSFSVDPSGALGSGGADVLSKNRAAQLARGLANWMADFTGLSVREDEKLLPGLMDLLEMASLVDALIDFPFLSQVSVVDNGNDAAVFRGTCALVGGFNEDGASAVGAGGGKVGYKTFRRPLIDVAIKVFKPPITGLTSETLEKIVRETRNNIRVALPRGMESETARASFPEHWRGGRPPPIVPFVGLCNCPPDLSLVMAWCNGGTLRSWIDTQVVFRRKRWEGGQKPGWIEAVTADGPAAVRYSRVGAEAKAETVKLGKDNKGGVDSVCVLSSHHCEQTWGWVVGITAADTLAMPLHDPECWPLDDLWKLDWAWFGERGWIKCDMEPSSPPFFSPLTIQCLHLATDAAAGVAFLSSFTPPLAHRDIKSLNYFLNSRDVGASVIDGPQSHIMEALLGDFGDSVNSARNKGLREERGTMAYMAPEVTTPYLEEKLSKEGVALAGEGGICGVEGAGDCDEDGLVNNLDGVAYDYRCDTFSLSVVLWEIFTGGSPYPSMKKNSLIKQQVHELHARPPIPAHIPRAIAYLIRAAWHPDPSRRPTAKVVARVMERCLEEALKYSVTA